MIGRNVSPGIELTQLLHEVYVMNVNMVMENTRIKSKIVVLGESQLEILFMTATPKGLKLYQCGILSGSLYGDIKIRTSGHSYRL